MTKNKYEMGAPLAYQGKRGCKNPACTQLPDEKVDSCYGWHCTYCDEVCSSQGHRCDVRDIAPCVLSTLELFALAALQGEGEQHEHV